MTMSQTKPLLLYALLIGVLTCHVRCSERAIRQADDDTVDDSSLGNVFNNFLNKLSNIFSDSDVSNSTTGNDVSSSTTEANATNTTTGMITDGTSLSNVTEEADFMVNVTQPNQQTTTTPVSFVTTRMMTTTTTSSRPMATSTAMEVDGRCYIEGLLQEHCAVPDELVDLSFWDLYSELFSDTVVQALVISCPKGVWCLQDRFDYWMALIMERVDMVMNSDISNSMCGLDMIPCMESTVGGFIGCPEYEKMDYAVDAIRLICELKQNPSLMDACYKHVVAALHVTLADIIRDESGVDQPSEELCRSPEVHMTKCLICMTNSCPGELEVINGFSPWSWFTSVVDDLIEECGLNPDKCVALMPPNATLVYQSELSTMIGVSVATMVTAVMLVVVVCLCYKRHRRHVVLRDGYEKLLTEGDES